MKVLLATPAYGGQVTESYFQSVLKLIHVAHAADLQIDVMTIKNESLITRARNNIVATFMAGDWTDLIFVDADIDFEPEHVLRLLESDRPLVATPYAMKGLDWEAVAAAETDHKEASIISVVNRKADGRIENGFAEALDAGTGFMRIKREVLEHMIALYPELAYTTDGVGEDGKRWALFDTMLAHGRYLSEDYAFCRRWQQIGGEVWVDVASEPLGHQGSYTYGK